jgi:hypothetical protein
MPSVAPVASLAATMHGTPNSGIFPGAMEFGMPGRGSKLFIELFRKTPTSGT